MSSNNDEKKGATRVAGSWRRKIVASELVEERKNIDFDVEECETILGGDRETIKQARAVQEMQISNAAITPIHNWYELTREEQQMVWFKQLNYIYRNLPEWRKTVFAPQNTIRYKWYYGFQGQPPTGLHVTMFCMSVETFCNEEQLKTWLPKIQNFDILGCYAQTEIGHGSDVASLKTTATFDKKAGEFVINTPSLDATKWWPGEMGRFANYALVFARCLVPDDDGEVNDYGIAPFLVQIRDLDTHRHMPGVKTGDMGPKFGYSSKDNGWMTLDNVRIPRMQMLMRFQGVDAEGNFEVNGNPKILFSTMLKTRVLIFCASQMVTSMILLIALRYSIVRRQFRNISGRKEETQLIDYQTQQMKLFPQLAQIFAHTISNQYIIGKFEEMLEQIQHDKFDLLDLNHHFSSGFKSVQTQDTMDGAFMMRQSLGGAGYSAWSGIPRIIDEYSPSVTFEGDNTVMAQQSFNMLLKQAKSAYKGKLQKVNDAFLYLKKITTVQEQRCQVSKTADLFDLDVLEQIMEHKVLVQIRRIVEKQMDLKDVSKKDFTNSVAALEIVKASQDHIRLFMFHLFKVKVQNEVKCANLRSHLRRLCALYALNQLNMDCRVCYETGFFKTGINYSDMILDAMKQLNLEIRPYALVLLEVYGAKDEMLQSAIGNSYGDIYETHLEWAKNSRLNHTKQGDAIPDGFLEYMMPILKGKL